MRGKRVALAVAEQPAGLIPAHAGKTRLTSRVCGDSGAHPRACGENSRVSACISPAEGSSPRMRGKLAGPRRGYGGYGLIPAHAGKTCRPSDAIRRRSAHPRACGENRSTSCARPRPPGSSPRMRGKLIDQLSAQSRQGLIPAHAGKTGFRRVARRRVPAHPRACGENRSTSCARPRPPGSSPRMRGKRQGQKNPVMIHGLIPAHAGKTKRL